MDQVRELLSDTSLEYFQKRHRLASAAEATRPGPTVSPRAQELVDQGIIDDLCEGPAPYRPRYVLPDYTRFMRQGSAYLDLRPPKDLYDAINAVQILYKYVPSITGFPVYLGPLDSLLEPYRTTVPEQVWRKLVEMFLVHVDRTLPDGFVHADLGPRQTETGRLILTLERGMRKAVPNLSLKVDADTPDEFILEAVQTALETGKPYFVNHAAVAGCLGEDYGVASCYNTLPVGGGSHTLVRMDLRALALRCCDPTTFLDQTLPQAVEALCEIIEARIKHLVDDARFFESSFLVREGLISLDRFTAMAGVFGLHEAVQHLSGGKSMGKDTDADELALAITKRAASLIKSRPVVYCKGTADRLGFHAQSGLTTDFESTAGVRIRIGDEPHMFDQIALQSDLQQSFDTGVSDIYVFEGTARSNPQAVLRIVRGALQRGMRLMAVGTNDSELVRISGYLVKRTDLERVRHHEAVREDSAVLGEAFSQNSHISQRPVRGL